MVWPAMPVGGPLFMTERFALDTVTSAAAVSFSDVGSLALVTVAMLLNVVPVGVPPGMFAVMVNVAVALSGSVAMVQLTVPPLPPGGVVQMNVGPLSCERETKVIVPGSGSFSVTVCASFGPLFVTVTVKA